MSVEHIEQYEEACQAVAHWGILPLSSFLPDHPSLESLTRPEAWHNGLQNDPWLWRDRLPAQGVAAYGRFLAGKPLFVSSELFPLLRCALRPDRTLEERYRDGLLARSTIQIYELIREQDGIDVPALRRLAGMRERADKTAFVNALSDLQSSAEIVIAGISERLNAHGNKSGWNSTCYTLADHWMAAHELLPLELTRAEAREQLLAWVEPRWSTDAVRYLRGKLR